MASDTPYLDGQPMVGWELLVGLCSTLFWVEGGSEDIQLHHCHVCCPQRHIINIPAQSELSHILGLVGPEVRRRYGGISISGFFHFLFQLTTLVMSLDVLSYGSYHYGSAQICFNFPGQYNSIA